MGKRKRSRDNKNCSSDEEDETKKIRREIKDLKKKLKKHKEKRRSKRSRSRESLSPRTEKNVPNETEIPCSTAMNPSGSADGERSGDVSGRNRSPSGSIEDIVLSGDETEKVTERTSEINVINSQTDPSVENPDIPEHEVDLDDEVLNAFGPRIILDLITGPAIHKDLVSRWTDILKKGLTVEEMKKLLEAYPLPKNCTIIEAPKLNAEVKAALPDGSIIRDNRIVEKQKRIAACLSAIGNSVTLVLKFKDEEKIKLLEHLNMAGRLLVSTLREETLVRKSLILVNLNASLKETLSNTSPDEWLFGGDLEEKLKSAKSLERSTKDLKAQPKQQQNKGSKNSKAPPRQSNFKSYQRMPGGAKKSDNNKPFYKKSYVKPDQQTRKRY